MTREPERISVLCVDDNENLASALRVMLSRGGDFLWRGWLPDADDLLHSATRSRPDIVLLDIDMPGLDPFQALADIARNCPATRVVIFTGHIRRELVDRALESGAWGYVSKSDGEEELLAAMRRVSRGELVLSPEVRAVCDRP